MKIIAGLGNPDTSYENNRHNVGFMFVDFVSDQLGLGPWESSDKFLGDFVKNEQLILLKPNTYMNSSGKSILSVMNYYKIKPLDLFVVHDDLDIKLGDYKIVSAKGPKLHGGINSIEDQLGTDEFTRVRIGVDNRVGDNRIEGVTYVLQNFEDQELGIATDLFPQIWQELKNKL